VKRTKLITLLTTSDLFDVNSVAPFKAPCDRPTLSQKSEKGIQLKYTPKSGWPSTCCNQSLERLDGRLGNIKDHRATRSLAAQKNEGAKQKTFHSFSPLKYSIVFTYRLQEYHNPLRSCGFLSCAEIPFPCQKDHNECYQTAASGPTNAIRPFLLFTCILCLFW